MRLRRMSRRRDVGFARSAKQNPADALRRFVLELSQTMGMTAAELGIRMSAAELTERRGLALVHEDEQRKANEG